MWRWLTGPPPPRTRRPYARSWNSYAGSSRAPKISIRGYARAEARVEAGEERAGAETVVSLAEASVTLLTLPFGTQLKFGQMRNRFGYSNFVHEHALPWIDRPNVLRNFLGDGGHRGVRLRRDAPASVAPHPPYRTAAEFHSLIAAAVLEGRPHRTIHDQ